MRQTGILLAISSLPGKYGIGDFSKKAFKLIDMLKRNHITHWQILPLSPIGYGHSPYQPFSSYAIDELYLDLDELVKMGLIKEPYHFKNTTKSTFEASRDVKMKAIFEAYWEYAKKKENVNRVDKFLKDNPLIKEYCEFISLKQENNGSSWIYWGEFRNNDKKVHAYAFAQMLLYKQWFAIKDYAKAKGIKIVGDVPFYVGFDSSDVYYHRQYFLLDEHFNPTVVAGVPPDYFSADGQKWGNPIYNWEVIEKENFDFLVQRIEAAAKLYDVVRIDHFRAFDSYWAINPSCKNAVDGEWRFPNGYGFFDALFARNPNLEIIAEDLGELRPEVTVLKDHYKMPGMRIMEFSYYDEVKFGKKFNTKNTVYYTGTHDNDTLLGWIEKPEVDFIKCRGDKWKFLLKYAIRRKEPLVVLPAQDVMRLDNSARMNCPGIIDDVNWTWKLKDFGEFRRGLSLVKEEIDRYGKKKAHR